MGLTVIHRIEVDRKVIDLLNRILDKQDSVYIKKEVDRIKASTEKLSDAIVSITGIDPKE